MNYSLAEAFLFYDIAWPRAICLDDEGIGFIMLSLNDADLPKEDHKAYFLWRFMIAKAHQNKGYGNTVLDTIVKKCYQEGVKTLYTSCEMEESQPYDFYMRYGFTDTGLHEDDEQILKLYIDEKYRVLSK